MSSVSYNFGLVAFVLFAAALYGYRAMLPKPIPGIPYKRESAQRILGDAPDVGRDLKFVENCSKLTDVTATQMAVGDEGDLELHQTAHS